MMIEYLKLANHKGLRECVLNNLGKINVFCGKNNGGKTTIVESIIDKEKCFVGKKLTMEHYALIQKNTSKHMGWSDANPQKPENRVYLRILNEVFDETKDAIWYSNESRRMSDIIEEKFGRSQLSRWAFNKNGIESTYSTFFSEFPKVEMLPPKREIEIRIGIDSAQQIHENGKGVTNYLFYAKNQEKSSPEKSCFDKIKDSFREISAGYDFEIFIEKGNILLLKFAYKDKAWIDANDCGLGLQDLLTIIFFSYRPENEVLLIEEPEIHMHPDMQRRLIYFLNSYLEKQLFLTTHSNVFLNSSFVDKVFYVFFDNGVKLDDATSRAVILNDIGYSITDNIVTDLIVLTEGPTDAPVIEEFLIKLELFKNYNIKIWPLGGDIMDKLDLSVFAERNNIIALIDKDPKSRVIRQRFIDNCSKYSIPVTRLERYSIENYFSLSALREVFKGQIPDTITEINPDTSVSEQLNISTKRNNRRIAQLMTLEEIEGTDLSRFFLKIKEICSRQITE